MQNGWPGGPDAQSTEVEVTAVAGSTVSIELDFIAP
jgi:hypothetical protein